MGIVRASDDSCNNAAVAESLSPRGINVHFEDHFDGGEIQFDYRMKPGPVTRSNALALMRVVGLDVDET